MFLRILCAIDGSPSSMHALDHAVDLARSGGGRLTILSVSPPAPPLVSLAGLSPERMQEEADLWTARLLAAAAEGVPAEVPVDTVQRSGHPGPAIVQELERGRHDLVVLGSRGRGMTREGLLGSVNGHVHFHARVPMLSVPDPDGPAAR